MFNARASAGVLAQVGHRADGSRPAVRPDRQRDPDRQRPLHDRAHATPAGASSSSATPTTGRATCRCGAASTTSTASSIATTRTARSRIEAFKAGEFDILHGIRRGVWVRQHAGAEWRRRTDQEARHSRRLSARACRPTTSTCAARSSRIPRARGARPDVRLRDINIYSDFSEARQQRFQQFRVRRRGHAVAGELALLEPFRAQLPPEVFGPAFVAPRTDSDPNAAAREPAEGARAAREAGWKLAADGKLRNARGEAFEFELLAPSRQDTTGACAAGGATSPSSASRSADPRASTSRSSAARLDEFDFDMATIVEPATSSCRGGRPACRLYGSKAADEKGSDNYRGVKSPAVDHLLAAMAKATTLEDLRDACRALDRLVMWSYWQVPELYSDDERLAYWTRFGIPAVHRCTSRPTSPPTSTPAWPGRSPRGGRSPPRSAEGDDDAGLHPRAHRPHAADAARRADGGVHRHPVHASIPVHAQYSAEMRRAHVGADAGAL